MKIMDLLLIDVTAEPEHISPVDAFRDTEITIEDIEKIIEAHTFNPWKWCSVKVTVSVSVGGCFFSHSEYLGCCSYDGRNDFIKNSGYYDDMVETCKNMIRARLKSVREELAGKEIG